MPIIRCILISFLSSSPELSVNLYSNFILTRYTNISLAQLSVARNILFNKENIAYVSLCCDRNMNDVFSSRTKFHVASRDVAECFEVFCPIEMTSFMFLSQHRVTKAMFYLFYKITIILRQKKTRQFYRMV